MNTPTSNIASLATPTLGSGRYTITFEIGTDERDLTGYSDQHLAQMWHIAQANPASYGNVAAGELVEKIGREIIRRWLVGTPPELWNHQGRDHLCARAMAASRDAATRTVAAVTAAQ